jgi:glycerol-1-phosphate dehydrogenase [NAD(P)+]
MTLHPESFSITDYLGHSFPCSCGRTHTTALREVILRPGAIGEVPALIGRLGCRQPLVLCDRNTWEAAAQKLCACLDASGVPYVLHRFDQAELVPDEAALGAALMALTPACDLVIGVGTGCLNDLSKYASFVSGRPYVIVGTAPSMDGFASIGAALMRGNLKVTLDAHVPAAIVGDTDVLVQAPMEMLLAGLGDILGKNTCLTDWQMSRIICGEYYCPVIASMVRQSLARVTACAQGVACREPEAVTALMEALVLAGVAMSFSGNSRPASGCEHHLSHFLEMRFLFDGRKPVLHGRKVGANTVVAAALYHRLYDETPDFASARKARASFDEEAWAKRMTAAYGKAAPGVIALEKQAGKNSPEACLKQIDAMEAHWEEIRQVIAGLPDAEKLADILRSVGAPSSPREVGVSKALFREGVVAAKEVRDRFTLWQMLWDLGLLEPYAAWAADHFYGKDDLS